MKHKNAHDLEAITRRKVEQRYDARQELLQHALPFVIVNVVLWGIWLTSGAGFPWPIFVTGGWGIGFLSHGLDYYNKHGRGAQKREAEIEAEVQRQLSLTHTAEARDRLSDEGEAGAAVYSLENFQGGGLRLSDDGELLDSQSG